jgi:hypothetical protein
MPATLDQLMTKKAQARQARNAAAQTKFETDVLAYLDANPLKAFKTQNDTLADIARAYGLSVSSVSIDAENTAHEIRIPEREAMP